MYGILGVVGLLVLWMVATLMCFLAGHWMLTMSDVRESVAVLVALVGGAGVGGYLVFR